MLFCPADRPDRFAKAAAVADVRHPRPRGRRRAVRQGACPSALRESALDPAAPSYASTRQHGGPRPLDLDALGGDTVRRGDVREDRTSQRKIQALSSFQVIALVETPVGVLAAPEITPQVSLESCGALKTWSLLWVADQADCPMVGSAMSRSTPGLSVLLAAGANGVWAIDSVFIDISDLAGVAEQADDAAASGFDAVACIHPSQVDVVRDAFRPTADEVDWASRVVAAAVGARRGLHGATDTWSMSR